MARALLRGTSSHVSPNARRSGSDLADYFRSNPGRPIHKWMHYFRIYEHHLAAFRDRDVVFVEFGVAEGGSLQMWRHYLGERARIVGVDIDPRCKAFEAPGTSVLIGDQEDREFLAEVAEHAGRIDVVIDDGGHTMAQQIATFEVLYPLMSDRGVYIVEDAQTSYWSDYGGGYRAEGTFIEYAKALTDKLNAWHSREPDLAVDDFTRSTVGIHFYNSVVVFERGPVKPPRARRTGSAEPGEQAAP